MTNYTGSEKWEPQLVVPQSLVRKVVYQNHDLIFASHPGQKRTFESICLCYWWPGMREDVNENVKQCDGCQRRKQGYEYRAPMGKVRMPTFPFEIGNMDLVGLYHKSQFGNRFCLHLWTNLPSMQKQYRSPTPVQKFETGRTWNT